MGFNSTVFLLNDAIRVIQEDPQGWTEAMLHQLQLPDDGSLPQEFGYGNHANGFWAVTNHHADDISLLAVGGNYPSVIYQGRRGNRGHHQAEDQVELLKRAADKLGYRLVKLRP